MLSRDDHLIIKLMEECGEVEQRAAKLLQFGPGEVQPGQELRNIERLRDEVNDLLAIVRLLEERGCLETPSADELEDHYIAKKAKIEKYLRLSISLGRVK